MAIELLVTNSALVVQGDPLAGWRALTAEQRYNEPGSGSVKLTAYPEVMAQLQPGNRLVVIRDRAVWMAGPLEVPQDYEWDLDSNADPGEVTVSFTDDLARVAGYLTFPEPGSAWAFQNPTVDLVRKLTNTSETIIRTLVNENCGPGAVVTRRIPQLVLDAAAGVGTARTLSTRMEPLLDACRTVAVPDGIGFRTRQVGTQIRFGVYQPRDLTGTARFSVGLGNLRKVRFSLSAPAATSELVMGGNDPAQQVGAGEPANRRAYAEVTSGAQASWYRVEKLVQASGKSNDDGELTQEGLLALGNDNPQASLSTETVDTEDLKAGRDYGLGDKVAVVLPTGLTVLDVVRRIQLSAESPDSGEKVTAVIGNGDTTTSRSLVGTVRQLAYRLGQIESRG
ncbi:siphovirus ReqiPepy6 Gp37-like family protein [Streptomyces sp. MBT56]|uniref:siphovirus ReqiPepy6 Gp37-like family protein n=1 Tax=unclassified Streptomyces TaxID=2593676 RepID=UPI00190C3F09|nr:MULTISPECIES: siphovirus ReqiPepy6 Gp37-like family protein [unclassified Streptomyces]MBK3561082.1 siphovirus ReqiPepy6 Gp37-like family protein [Streptomyces sp. MBT56]MBK3602425.1 siphovirus ReqiPepy6 Gp37-like family protein [Streptomyces sp. MBT54]MBK3615486.1 siphovirus ReqiPepy6 Gp37-like family protein [Streptomyces sp. MBT98]